MENPVLQGGYVYRLKANRNPVYRVSGPITTAFSKEHLNDERDALTQTEARPNHPVSTTCTELVPLPSL